MRAMFLVATLVTSVINAAEMPTGPPWLWTDQERIRERFDPESIRSRIAAAQQSVRQLKAGSLPINGLTDPALFFPWELMDRFLAELQAPPDQQERRREAYRSFINAAGWDYTTFWREIDQESQQYLAIRSLINAQQKRTLGHLAQSEREQLDTQLCVARAAAMVALATEFGKEAFDKFLYTAVAPRIRMWTTAERDEDTLMRVEAGCK